jgi:hypothetical protein
LAFAKPAGSDKFGQYIELLDQFIIELLPAPVHAGFRQIMGKWWVFNRDTSYD